jgi:hypothetical protein
MTEIRLRYDGNGKFSPASHVDYTTAIEEFEQGEEFVAKLTRPRSSRENRLFHGSIKSAYDNQRGGPRFEDEADVDGWMRLRGWLLCQAGHCDVHRFTPGALAPEAVATLRQVYGDAFWAVEEKTGAILMRVPKTVRFSTLKHPDFQPVKDKVFQILCNEIVPGTTPEQLMEIRFAKGHSGGNEAGRAPALREAPVRQDRKTPGSHRAGTAS